MSERGCHKFTTLGQKGETYGHPSNDTLMPLSGLLSCSLSSLASGGAFITCGSGCPEGLSPLSEVTQLMRGAAGI